MNRLIIKLLLSYSSYTVCSLFLLACGSKQVTSASTQVDQAKIDQIKKLIAEQAAQNSPSTSKAGSNTTETLDPKALVSLTIKPGKFEVTEGLIDDSLRVIATQRSGDELTLKGDVSFTLHDAGLIEIIDDPESASFAIKALKPGTCLVTARYKNLDIDFKVEVKAKQVSSIEIVPKALALGVATRFRLAINYDNFTQTDITEGIQWQSNNASYLLAASDGASSGIFTGQAVGTVGMKAEYQGLSVVGRTLVQMPSIRSISVTADSNSLLLGSSSPVKAMATFMNGTVFDISSSVQWSVSDTSIASINSTGTMEAIYPGEVTVRAAYGNVFGEESFTVSSVVFKSYRIEPSSASIPLGMTQSFKLFGILPNNQEQDISVYTRWSSSDDSIVRTGGLDEVPVRGLYAALQKGSATVFAKYGSTQFQVPFTVNDAALVGLTIKTDNPDGVCGVNSPQFHAEGLLSDSNSKDMTSQVTWSVSPSDFATPSSALDKKGLFVTKKSGTAIVTASFLEPSTNQIIQASAPISASASVATGIAITAPQTSLAIGQGMQLEAAQVASCGSGTSYTEKVSWSTNNTNLITLSNAVGTKGLLSTKGSVNSPVTVVITATSGTFTASFDLEVRPKEVSSISISPVSPQLVVGGNTTTPILTATYTDNTTADMTVISNFPGYSVTYALTDCTSTGCGSMSSSSGLMTSGNVEGLIRPKAILTTPSGKIIVSSAGSVKVVSKCTAPGTRSGYYCVFLGSLGQSCSQVCQAQNRSYHAATLNTLGSAGDPLECSEALYNLGYTKKLETDKFDHDVGVGCSIWTVPALGIQQSVRETATTTDSSSLDVDFQRVCACQEP